MNNPLIVLMRHASSVKNIQNRHGGTGSELIVNSKIEIASAINVFKQEGVAFKKVICAPRLQCIKTAEFLASAFKIESAIDYRMKPISLGIIDGLSDEEVREKYPDIACQMHLWRSGKCEINKVIIPNILHFAL